MMKYRIFFVIIILISIELKAQTIEQQSKEASKKLCMNGVLREDTQSYADTLTLLEKGTEVTVLYEVYKGSNFYKVNTGKFIGYLHKKFLCEEYKIEKSPDNSSEKTATHEETSTHKETSPREMSSLQKGTRVKSSNNVYFIINLTYEYTYDDKRKAFKAKGIIENRNSLPVALYNARLRLYSEYTFYTSSGKSSNKERSTLINFPDVFILKPGSYIENENRKTGYATKNRSEISVDPNKYRAQGTVKVINPLKKTNDMINISIGNVSLLDNDDISISIKLDTKPINRLDGNYNFYKFTPVITVTNNSSRKIKLKKPISFYTHYGGYRNYYEIQLGKIQPGETESHTGFGDRSPAMNFTPDVYISNIEFPEIDFK